MPEIGTSGLMSGDGKRGGASAPPLALRARVEGRQGKRRQESAPIHADLVNELDVLAREENCKRGA